MSSHQVWQHQLDPSTLMYIQAWLKLPGSAGHPKRGQNKETFSVEDFLCNCSLKTIAGEHVIFTRTLDSTWHLPFNMSDVTHLTLNKYTHTHKTGTLSGRKHQQVNTIKVLSKSPWIVLHRVSYQRCKIQTATRHQLWALEKATMENGPDQKWQISISQRDPFIVVGAYQWEGPV